MKTDAHVASFLQAKQIVMELFQTNHPERRRTSFIISNYLAAGDFQGLAPLYPGCFVLDKTIVILLSDLFKPLSPLMWGGRPRA